MVLSCGGGDSFDDDDEDDTQVLFGGYGYFNG